jgi:hypothetical protein
MDRESSMHDQPLVSIVTPSYNQARFLGQAVESVLAQDYPHIEYLVLDGGSTDGSVEILRAHEDRIAHWVSQPDAGQASAINRGWQRSRGQILAWLNSDDRYEPGAVSAIVEAFRRHPEVGVVTGDCRVIDGHGATVKDLPSGVGGLYALLAGNSLPQQGVFCRRQAVAAAGWLDASLDCVFDWALWLKLELLGARFHHLPRVVASFRVWGDSKTASGTVGASLSGGIRFARERFRVLTGLVVDPAPARDPARQELIRAAWLGGMLEMGLLHRIQAEPDRAAGYLAQFTKQAPETLETLPFPQALAAHLAYVEEDIEALVDDFVEELARHRRGSGAAAHPEGWRRELLAETYLVRAWNASHHRDQLGASGLFLRAVAAQPLLALQRRVASPAIKALFKTPFAGRGAATRRLPFRAGERQT